MDDVGAVTAFERCSSREKWRRRTSVLVSECKHLWSRRIWKSIVEDRPERCCPADGRRRSFARIRAREHSSRRERRERKVRSFQETLYFGIGNFHVDVSTIDKMTFVDYCELRVIIFKTDKTETTRLPIGVSFDLNRLASNRIERLASSDGLLRKRSIRRTLQNISSRRFLNFDNWFPRRSDQRNVGSDQFHSPLSSPPAILRRFPRFLRLFVWRRSHRQRSRRSTYISSRRWCRPSRDPIGHLDGRVCHRQHERWSQAMRVCRQIGSVRFDLPSPHAGLRVTIFQRRDVLKLSGECA